jgi:hypothetical protein
MSKRRIVFTVLLFALLGFASRFFGVIAFMFLLAFPVLSGMWAKRLTVNFDRAHEPEQDFSMIIYFVMWVIIGLVLYAVYPLLLTTLNIAPFLRFMVFLAGYVAGLYLPQKSIRVRPNSGK